MTTAPGETPATRFARLLRAARTLEAAKVSARTAWETRVAAEAQLETRLRELDAATRGLRTWLPRLTGRLGDVRRRAEEAVRQQEPLTLQAVAAQQAAVEALAHAQAANDELPAAREAAVAALDGSEAEEARRIMAAAQKLAEAMFTANSVSLDAAGIDSQLDSADNWSTVDTYLGGGWTASAMKQDAIYDANDKAAALTDRLTTLRGELQAMRIPTSYFAIQMNDFAASIDLDLIFDNFFTDYAMAKRIDNSQERVQRLMDGLMELTTRLGERRNELLTMVDALIARSAAG